MTSRAERIEAIARELHPSGWPNFVPTDSREIERIKNTKIVALAWATRILAMTDAWTRETCEAVSKQRQSVVADVALRDVIDAHKEGQ